MAHRKAKLTPLGRMLLVERIEVLGWPVRVAAESMGVSAATAYKWRARFRVEGLKGLEDRSSRPHRCPHQADSARVARVLGLRSERRWGPHRIAYALGIARSSVYAILRRAGHSRLSDFDRPTRRIVRYQRERPGELVHIDVKRLARIPDGAATGCLAARPAGPTRPARDAIWTSCTPPSMTAPASPMSRCTPTSARRRAPGFCAGPPPSSPVTAW